MEWLGGTKARTWLSRRASGRVFEVARAPGSASATTRSTSTCPRWTSHPACSPGHHAAPPPLAGKSGASSATSSSCRTRTRPSTPLPPACTFCSVGDPVRGLREVCRVVKPAGQVLLYEHVRPRNPLPGWLADLLSPLTRRLSGPASTGAPSRTFRPPACRSPTSGAAGSGGRSWPAGGDAGPGASVRKTDREREVIPGHRCVSGTQIVARRWPAGAEWKISHNPGCTPRSGHIRIPPPCLTRVTPH